MIRNYKRFIVIIGNVIKKNNVLFIFLILAMAGSIIFALFPPLVLQKVVDLLTVNKEIIIGMAILYFATVATGGIFDAAKEAMITIFGQKVTTGIRHEMCSKLLLLPASYFTKTETGKISSRFINDVDIIQSLFDNGIMSMFVDAGKLVSVTVAIFIISPGLGLMLLVILPLLYIFTRFVQNKMLAAQLENRIAIEKVNNHVPETIKNISMIHSFHKERFMEFKYDEYIKENYILTEKSNLYDSVYSPVIIFSSSVVISLLMILSSMGDGMQNFFGMTVGTAVAVIAYVSKVFEPMESIGMEIQNIQSAMAGMKRIEDFLEEDERPVQIKKTESSLILNNKEKGISFENVCFGYNTEDFVLNDFNLNIKQGERIKITGKTGAGKSTLFRLLLGLYEPYRGSIRVFGKKAGDICDTDKRNIFGYVDQKFRIVPGNIADQISLFDDSIDTTQIQTAAKIAGIHDTIMKFEKGYSTVADDKIFSQGQLQLLAIARAIVCNPPILLLDEMTANLDSNTEKMIVKSLESASHERTVIEISHRVKNEKDINNYSIYKTINLVER